MRLHEPKLSPRKRRAILLHTYLGLFHTYLSLYHTYLL